MSLEPLISLCHHRWNLPVLAELYRDSGCKFVTLVNRLGISRDSLQRSLRALIAAGLARRNPGYGHPLRPEYVLTEGGAPPGKAALALLSRLPEADRGLALKKWTLPILAAVGAGAERFGELREALPKLTPRALTLALKALATRRWLRREVEDGYPPRARYRLGEAAEPWQGEMNALLKALARF